MYNCFWNSRQFHFSFKSFFENATLFHAQSRQKTFKSLIWAHIKNYTPTIFQGSSPWPALKHFKECVGMVVNYGPPWGGLAFLSVQLLLEFMSLSKAFLKTQLFSKPRAAKKRSNPLFGPISKITPQQFSKVVAHGLP